MSIDKYHTYKIVGKENEGFHIEVRNISNEKKPIGFVGSKKNVRMFKRKELAERHKIRLENGLSKLSLS